MEINIISTCKIVNRQGRLTKAEDLLHGVLPNELRIKEFNIAPFSMGWNFPLPPGYIKSACSPIEALIQAKQLLTEAKVDLVIIKGTDHSKSDFQNNRSKRNELLKVYGELSFLQAFDQVVESFIAKNKISETNFKRIAEALFENYWKTWISIHPNAKRPNTKWFQNISGELIVQIQILILRDLSS